MRDYDEARKKEDNHTFKIRGESFRLRRVRPEVLDELVKIEEKLLKAKSPTYGQVVKTAEERLLLLLDPADSGHERWQALREQEDDPIEYAEIIDLSRWMYEVLTSLPTMQPTPSAVGRGKTAA